MLYNVLVEIWSEAMDHNISNICSLLEKAKDEKVVDIGCGDGQLSLIFKNQIGGKEITGFDGVKERLKAAKKRGVSTVLGDIEKKWPFSDNSFDVVISNQVIEHLYDIDHYISETYRILKPGGYTVVSTENLSSWHNIFALILGFQDFSHHIIKKKHVSNPLSPHYGKKTCTWSKEANSGVDDTAYPHIKILTYKSLISSFKEYDFTFEKGKGSGYYPLFWYPSFFVSSIDPNHSHFITAKFRKPKRPHNEKFK